jgi:ribosome-associated protein
MHTTALELRSGLVIPAREIELTFVRAGGPGGQNVNKVASKVVLRFDLRHSPSIPDSARRRALAALATRLTRDGVLVLSAQAERDQVRNRAAVLERLRALLEAAVRPRKRRVPTKPTTAARERRITAKKVRAAIKRERGRTDEP